jgi:hypothetical protein
MRARGVVPVAKVGRSANEEGPPTKRQPVDLVINGKLILLLIVSVLILIPLVGVLYDFHHGSGRAAA